MPKEDRQSFTSSGGYVARKGFRFMGRDFLPGDSFPWKQLGCSTRRLRQLYEGRVIDPAGDMVLEELSPETPVDEATAGAADDTVKDPIDTEDDDEPFIFNPDVHSVENPKKGKWIISHDGQFIVEIYRKLGLLLRNATEPVILRPDDEGDLEVVEE